jgi:sporulation protein YlmC with PRC-barrel domain
MKEAIKFSPKWMVVTLCLAASAAAWAHGPNDPVAGEDSSSITANRNNPPPDESAASSDMERSLKMNRCSHILGALVENPQGDKLGKIHDVVLNFNNSQVSYCVLSVEHGLFARHKYIAVPLAAFQPSADGSRLVLNADKNRVAQAEGFDLNHWPSATNPLWGAQPLWPMNPKATAPAPSDVNQNNPSTTSH